jgi:hypothetical protein
MRTVCYRVLACILFVAFATFFSVGIMLTMSHAHGEHGHVATVPDCPFMTHEDTLCPMTAIEYLAAFRKTFEGAIPSILVLALTFSLVGYLTPTFIGKDRERTRTHSFMRWRKDISARYSWRLYQDIFARGVLHPKVH